MIRHLSMTRRELRGPLAQYANLRLTVRWSDGTSGSICLRRTAAKQYCASSSIVARQFNRV
jgi:hypothetical protein